MKGKSLMVLGVGSLVGVGFVLYSETFVTRFVRTAYVGTLVTLDYKWNLRGLEAPTRGIDKNSPENEIKFAKYNEILAAINQRSADRLVWLCKKNKGLYIKIGQHIASMNHVLPEQYTTSLSVFQNSAPTSSFGEVEKVFLEDMQKHPDDIFVKFDRDPIASASLAQVFRASMKDENGQEKEVAVKVQHPSLKKHFFGDIKTLEIVFTAAAYYFPGFEFRWVLPEIRDAVLMELDFMNEGRNSERIANDFKDNKYFSTPKIIWPLTSTRILTMEFITNAVKISDIEGIKKLGLSTEDVSRSLLDIFNEQIFVTGFLHSDPHPANIFVRNYKGTNKTEIVLLDHGLYRQIDEEVRINYCRLWKALVLGDVHGVEEYGRKLGAGDYYKFLAAILTLRPTITNLNNTNKPTSEEFKKLREEAKALGGRRTITRMLENLPRDLLLIFRTNNFIRSIHATLGSKTNRFVLAAKASLKGAHAKDKKINFWGRINYFWELAVFNFRLKLIDWGLRLYALSGKMINF